MHSFYLAVKIIYNLFIFKPIRLLCLLAFLNIHPFPWMNFNFI
jgi:hypothetical protein